MTQAPTLEQLLRGALDRIKTLEADIDRFVDVFPGIVERLRGLRAS